MKLLLVVVSFGWLASSALAYEPGAHCTRWDSEGCVEWSDEVRPTLYCAQYDYKARRCTKVTTTNPSPFPAPGPTDRCVKWGYEDCLLYSNQVGIPTPVTCMTF